MKKLAVATALMGTLFTTSLYAYQFELGAGYEKTDFDAGGDIDTVAVSGKYYLKPVTVKSGTPHAEAAFLNKASNVAAGYARASTDGNEDIDVLGVNGEFFIPDTQFYVSGTINQVDAGEKNTGYGVEAGYLPVQGLLVAVGVSKESLDPVFVAKHGVVSSLGYAAAVDEDTTVTLRGKYVTQIGNFYTNFEGNVYVGDETAYKLGADLYIDPTLSIGASFADTTADGSETLFNIRAQKFLTPNLAVSVGYSTSDHTDSYGLQGTIRF